MQRQAFQELRPGRGLAWSGRALAGQALRRDRHQPAHRLPVGGRLPRRAVVGQPRPRQQQPLARPGDRLVEELSLGALGGEFQRQAALDAQAPAVGVAQEGVLAQRRRELPFGEPQHRDGPEGQAARLDDVGDQDFFAVGVSRQVVGGGVKRARQLRHEAGKVNRRNPERFLGPDQSAQHIFESGQRRDVALGRGGIPAAGLGHHLERGGIFGNGEASGTAEASAPIASAPMRVSSQPTKAR